MNIWRRISDWWLRELGVYRAEKGEADKLESETRQKIAAGWGVHALPCSHVFTRGMLPGGVLVKTCKVRGCGRTTVIEKQEWDKIG